MGGPSNLDLPVKGKVRVRGPHSNTTEKGGPLTSSNQCPLVDTSGVSVSVVRRSPVS